jgi:hypothetical protein
LYTPDIQKLIDVCAKNEAVPSEGPPPLNHLTDTDSETQLVWQRPWAVHPHKDWLDLHLKRSSLPERTDTPDYVLWWWRYFDEIPKTHNKKLQSARLLGDITEADAFNHPHEMLVGLLLSKRTTMLMPKHMLLPREVLRTAALTLDAKYGGLSSPWVQGPLVKIALRNPDIVPIVHTMAPVRFHGCDTNERVKLRNAQKPVLVLKPARVASFLESLSPYVSLRNRHRILSYEYVDTPQRNTLYYTQLVTEVLSKRSVQDGRHYAAHLAREQLRKFKTIYPTTLQHLQLLAKEGVNRFTAYVNDCHSIHYVLAHNVAGYC